MLAGILHRHIDLDQRQPWKQTAHEMLIDSVIGELARSSGETATEDKAYDDLREALRELYSIQARLLGVPPDKYAAAEIPSQLLRLIAEQYQMDISSWPSAASNGSAPAKLPQEFDAIDYVGENDLQRTVLLQRLWLQVLASGLGKAKKKQASELIAGLRQADRMATDVFAQLRDGERALLQTWLLLTD
jgi:hypothetical protein